MKRVCVIGSNGRLGSAICKELSGFDLEIIKHSGKSDVDFTKEIEVVEFSKNINNLDYLYCTVGQKIEGSAFGEIDIFKEIIEINLFSVFLCCKHLIPKMNANSSVVLIGSSDGCFGNKSTMYSTAKSALHTYSKCLSKELKEKKINVNCIALGTLFDESTIDHSAKSIVNISMSSQINGQIIRVDGGNHTFPC